MSAAETHASAAAAAGIPYVLGTSGLSPTQEAAVAAAALRIPIVYAANFAPGVNLFLAIAETGLATLALSSQFRMIAMAIAPSDPPIIDQ